MKKWMMKVAMLGLALGGLLPVSQAASNGAYIGGDAGMSNVSGFKRQLTNGQTLSINNQKNRFAGQLFAGYRFAPYFALEGGYTTFGQPTFTSNAGDSYQLDLRALYLDTKGILPLGESFNLYARGGLAYMMSAINDTGPNKGLIIDNSVNVFTFKLGVGGDFEFYHNVAIFMQYERYFKNKEIHESNLLGLGLTYTFG